MVGIRNIQIVYLEGPLNRVCLPYCLKDAGECASKLHGLRGDIPFCGIINTGRPIFRLCDRSRMTRGLRCSWGTAAIRDSLIFSE